MACFAAAFATSSTSTPTPAASALGALIISGLLTFSSGAALFVRLTLVARFRLIRLGFGSRSIRRWDYLWLGSGRGFRLFICLGCGFWL